jgi:hypothetical protein
MLAPPERDKRRLILPSVAMILIVVILGGAIWTYTTKDWNASGTQKARSPVSSAPSEGGKAPILNR